MKRFVFLTCIGSLALALTAWGVPQNKSTTRSARGRSAPSAHAVSPRGGSHVAAMRGGGHTIGRAAPMRASRGISGSRVRPSAITRANTLRSNRMEAARMRSARAANARIGSGRMAVNRERNLARANNLRTGRVAAPRTPNARMAGTTRAMARQNLAVNRQRNLTFAHNVMENRAGNVRVTDYWHTDRFNTSNYAAFYNYNQQWHDRGWWQNNYSNIVFVLGGWWYWDASYWYPAWGYDPYAWYSYDGPIYTGYANLRPDRIVVEVQQQLAADGYYAGSIDGRLGPQTRAALAAFQSDNGLAVTSAIDRPTLQTLGLT